jgi:class 3 adenylate cyclase
VECLKCGFTNPEQARFCTGCGAGMSAIKCSHCNTENSPGSRFCNSCGQALTGDAPKNELLSAHAERRILTVLFCDLVDSTKLVDNLDPELSRAIIRDFQTICKEATEKFEGRVSTYLGDGIVALFSRHESNAERAINTALEINREIARATGSFSQSNQKIEVRCGIATGLAVVGDDMLGHSQLRQETAIGLPLNLAARIQSLAEPGGVAIGDATYQMTSGLFEFEDIGRHPLKGIKEPQQVWLVTAEKSINSRFVAHAAALTPMVDRTEILEKLKACWDKSILTEGEVVVFTGEPGVGKSRITQELNNKISTKGDYLKIEYQCSPYHTNTALYPVISRLKAASGFEHGESPADQIGKLEELIRRSSDDFQRDMPAFVDLLSLPAEDKWPAPNLEPDEKRNGFFLR